MTAIAGASAGVRDMSDGSLRITVEFEPKDAKAAFELFGGRGTPIAVAALKVGYAAVQASTAKPEASRMGPLCREAVQLCGRIDYQEWAHVRDPAAARLHVLEVCGIDSRKELDMNDKAAEKFRTLIRLPFMAYMRTREKVAA